MFEVYAQDYRITIQEIPLGNQGEDMARCLVIDITDAVNEFGSGGTVSVRNKRNGDELPYFCTNVSTVTGADAEGNVHTYIKWTLTDVDTAAAGSGFVQADYIISGVTVKTWVYKYFILPSLGITGDVPDPYEDILEEIEAQVSAVQAAAASAAASAAQASAEATRIISTTQEVVEDWLSDHIVTGYTVDDTLTISGAAADSKKAGDMIRAAFVTEQTSGSIASFTDGADNVPLKDLVVNIQPKQAGTGDPSPSNVRAISGWTEANITRTGKNLVNENNWDSGHTISATGVITSNGSFKCSNAYMGILPNTKYTLQLDKNTTSDSGLSAGTFIAEYDASFNFLRRTQIIAGGTATGTITGTYTSHASARFAKVSVYIGSINVQLEQGTAATEYESYNGNTYNITFGTAGTVYGGTLDVTTGMLTVTHQTVTFTDRTGWQYRGSNSNYAGIFSNTNNYIYDHASTAFYTNIYSVGFVTGISGARSFNFSVYSGTDGNSVFYLRPNDGALTSLAELDTFLAANPLQVVYPLAQPVSYQLTPTEVKTLLANNNIWSDTGSVASCEYRADTKLYLEKLTNPDDDMVANANITSGQYFMVGNSLYLATANIANGGAITPGTNCTATNLAAALNAINS